MKKQDFYFIAGAAVVLTLFLVCAPIYDGYTAFNAGHPYLAAFVKFALLATAGEALGLRIQRGRYNEKGFGLAPRAVVWGLLGVWIAAAFKVYTAGVPAFAASMGMDSVAGAMQGGFSGYKLACAAMISIALNTTFGPVFMTLHKVTDTHILTHGGSLRALTKPIHVGAILAGLNWQVQWGFVFKKTIPLFWIPAHTLTFLLPGQYQVLFAALLGVALGVLLSIAAIAGRKTA